MDYQSSVKDVDSVTKEISISIPTAAVAARFEKEIANVSHKVKIDGFRPGKAPRDLVVKRHGLEIRQEVVQKLIGDSIGEIVKEHKINYVGQPELNIESDEEGKDLKFKANFFIYPAPELKKYDGFHVKLPVLEVADKEVSAVVDRLRNANADFKKIDGRTEIKDGDNVDCTIQVMVDGVSNGPASPMRIELGREDVPAELTEALKGAKLGEMKVVTIKSVSEDERNIDKKISYHVTPDAIFEKILPELTDTFVKTVDASVATVLELRLKINDLLKKDKEEQSRLKAEGFILKELASRHDFKVPQIMIDMEIYNMLARANMLDPNAVPFERFQASAFRERMGKSAEDRVKASVLVDKIAEEEKLLPNDEETKKWFDEQKEKLGAKAFDQFVKDKGYVQSAWMDYTRKKVLDFLLTKTKTDYIAEEEFNKWQESLNKKSQ